MDFGWVCKKDAKMQPLPQNRAAIASRTHGKALQNHSHAIHMFSRPFTAEGFPSYNRCSVSHSGAAARSASKAGME